LRPAWNLRPVAALSGLRCDKSIVLRWEIAGFPAPIYDLVRFPMLDGSGSKLRGDLVLGGVENLCSKCMRAPARLPDWILIAVIEQSSCVGFSLAGPGSFTGFVTSSAFRCTHSIGHSRSSHANRLRRSRRGVARSLMLHRSVDLGAQ